jgi:glucose-1-phosphate cytidylyltransferase
LPQHTPSIPKPLIEIGRKPILWHVLQIYLAAGFRRFILLTGYRAELIADFIHAETWPAGTSVHCLDTGIDTPTGGRLWRAAEFLDDEAFCVAYADGVADLDLRRLLSEHLSHGTRATMTVVRPTLQFGVAELNGDGLVRGFVEKPRSQHWINGGFFCFEPSVLKLLDERSTLERDPLTRLAASAELRAFRHEGFWDCLDTYKDALLLNDLWAEGRAPWKRWD